MSARRPRLSAGAMAVALVTAWLCGASEAQAAATGNPVRLHQTGQPEQKVVSCAGGICQCTIGQQAAAAGGQQHQCGGGGSGSSGQLPGAHIPAVQPPRVRRPGEPTNDASKYINVVQWRRLFKHSNDARCSPGFYTYAAFREAVAAFPKFANDANHQRNKRELVAFLAQISQETTGGWPTAPDGPYSWGLCFREGGGAGAAPEDDYCTPSDRWPCAPGKSYHGRGPLPLRGNHMYGAAGEALGLDLLSQPELVATDPVVAFKAALWRWMTPQAGRPSCHEAVLGTANETAEDKAGNRRSGYGWVTNILTGGAECGRRPMPPQQLGRIGFFKKYAAVLGVRLGPNLNCADQRPYGVALESSVAADAAGAERVAGDASE